LRPKNHILVFGPNDNQRHATSLILRRAGYSVISAPRLPEFIQNIHDRNPDSIICDLEGLDHNSIISIYEVLSLKPDIPVIVFSSDPFLQSEIRSLDWKRYIYQPKPISSDCLLSLMVKILPIK
jgi:DNA-binding NtrC family response regulator